ncbi:aKG-HExxH-type peptide beta-hydroxylase [Streptomyces inhibens]|uniref:aKG-HExxH-type peptide beta-hydroxylase n=1 Tax=Streptomyces inhibens TaxID=2293571 RepID=UPI0015F2533C|nr:HEXXH motif-containing putative peptide modification protein [Streptomyces inhibens]
MLRVAPDALEATRDEEAVRRVAQGVLAAAGVRAAAVAGPVIVAAAFAVQAGLRVDVTGSQKVAMREPLEPVGPAPYLARSVARALATRPDGAEATGGSQLTGWQRADHAILDRCRAALAAAWPEMLAELRVCVAQVALLEGRAIDGFTDFATHGAVYINRARLGASPLGLPGPVRFAEALVHEGTHTRCNAAQLSNPFLTPAAGGADLVRTPLRSDPRPLAGLFQQAVVLARCTALYGRLLNTESTATAALTARQDRLSDGARQAIGTLRQHSATLTEHGLAVLGECDALLRPTAV